MRIVIKDSEMRFPIKLHLPASLLLPLSRFAIRFLPLKSITPRQAKRLVKELKRCKRRFRGLKLVEVHSADGDVVEISL